MQLSVLVFGDRLQLCRQMTFRSSCSYFANPCGALMERPTEVMDDCVCQNEAHASKCVLYLRKEESERVAVLSSHLQQIPLRDLYKETFTESRTRSPASFSLYPSPVSAFTLPPSICNDPRDAVGCNVSASSVLP